MFPTSPRRPSVHRDLTSPTAQSAALAAVRAQMQHVKEEHAGSPAAAVRAQAAPAAESPAALSPPAPSVPLTSPPIVSLPLPASEPPAIGGATPVPMVPNAGLWGDYMMPVGDGFTGTRGGVNYFRGHVWAAEGLAQGGGTGTVQSYAFAQWLRHHLPMLLGAQGQAASVGPQERAELTALLAELGGAR